MRVVDATDNSERSILLWDCFKRTSLDQEENIDASEEFFYQYEYFDEGNDFYIRLLSNEADKVEPVFSSESMDQFREDLEYRREKKLALKTKFAEPNISPADQSLGQYKYLNRGLEMELLPKFEYLRKKLDLIPSIIRLVVLTSMHSQI